MLGLASGANCPTAQTSSAEVPATAASELSLPPTLGLATWTQSPVQLGEPGVSAARPGAGTSPGPSTPQEAAPKMSAVTEISFAFFVVVFMTILLTEPRRAASS